MEKNDLEESIITFLNLLFRRLDNKKMEVIMLKEEFDLKLQLLKKACKSNSQIEISNCRKDILNKFKNLLQFSCVDDAQSLYCHFSQELNVLIDKIKNDCQCGDSFVIDGETKSFISSNDPIFLFNDSKESMKNEKELILIKTQIQTLRNMSSVYKKEKCLEQLNVYIKNEIFGKASINDNIKSAIRLATDVDSVIDMMNQSVKNS